MTSLRIGLEAFSRGNLAEAERVLQSAFTSGEVGAGEYQLAGLIAATRGDLKLSIENFQKSIAVNAQDALCWFNLGVSQKKLHLANEAIASFRQAVNLLPSYHDAWLALAAVYKGMQEYEHAFHSLQKALVCNPCSVDAFLQLGHLARLQSDTELAKERYQEVLRLKPTHFMAVYSLGLVYLDTNEITEAVRWLREAVKIDPQNAKARFKLGLALQSAHELIESERQYLTALELNQNYLEAYTNLGSIYLQADESQKAINCFENAIRIEPNYPAALCQLLRAKQSTCCWTGLTELCNHIEQINENSGLLGQGNGPSPDYVIPPFVFLGLSTSTSHAQQYRCATNWYERQLAKHISAPVYASPQSHDDRLTIGYLSADFRNHPVAELIVEALESHCKEHFRVVCYSYGPNDKSTVRRRVEAGVEIFRDIQELSTLEAAKRIAYDGVAILVDLTGYTQYCRTEILALRPSPIQINYLGYPGTLGASFIDYVFVDEFIVPPTEQPYFSEKLFYLPGCYQANDGSREIAETQQSRKDHGLPEDGFVYCCFNNSYKITPAIFDIWMRLLQFNPRGVLWLLDCNAETKRNLRCEAETRGVSVERIVFAPRVPLPDHLARYRHADLFLDTFPYNAHTTASDALWAGCPLLTHAGSTFASRVAGSILRSLGLDELITYSMVEYEHKAMQLTRDHDALRDVRARLADVARKSEVFDGKRFATKLESAYREIWQAHRHQRSPSSL